MAVTTIGTTAERLRNLILIRKRKKLKKCRRRIAASFQSRLIWSMSSCREIRQMLTGILVIYERDRAVIEQQADLELRDLDVRLAEKEKGSKK